LQTSPGPDGDEPAVIACCFSSKDPALTGKDVRNYAKERLLPQVLSLTRFYRFEKLPLTTNGKIDRAKLESMIATEVEAVIETPSGTSSVRDRILAMWQQLLGLEVVNPDANFFELGGDSMTAIRLLRRLREEMHPDVKLDDIYEFPSVSQLSTRVEQLLSEQVLA
jgi:acyl carrier protein